MQDEFRKLNRLFDLLKSGALYSRGPALRKPVGLPAELIDDGYLSTNPYWSEPDLKVFHEALRRDPVPIPHHVNREGYCKGYDLGYWLFGYGSFRRTLEAVEKHGCVSGKLLDFGGSTGRVFRHFAFQRSSWDVWSCDFRAESVEFNQRYFPPSIKTFLNSAQPSLPLADGEFDLVTAYSVFTHLDETETAWLLELRRILRIGGIAYLTIHDANTWLHRKGVLRKAIEKFRPDIAREPELPRGRTVIFVRDDDPFNCHVFHDEEYIRRNWGRFFRILEIRPMCEGEQAAVVCQRIA